jgi:hypothetical protein
MTTETYNKIQKKIARQNKRTQDLIANYIRPVKRVTRVTFSRKAQWDYIDTTKVYYSHVKLQA